MPAGTKKATRPASAPTPDFALRKGAHPGIANEVLTGYVLIFKPVWSLLITPLDIEDLARWEAVGQFVSIE